MDRRNRVSQLSFVQLWGLTILRIVIGWHFLYEGFVKLVDPNWTSAAFLTESRWIFSGVFHWMAGNQTVLAIVDFMNIWGLILIGLGLVFGLFSRIAAISGIVLLSLYYIAMPPLIGNTSGIPAEGNYLIVDKNLVELFSLMILALFPTGKSWGLDRVIAQVRGKKAVSTDREETPAEDEGKGKPKPSVFLPRRELLKNLISLPVVGGFIYALFKKRGWESLEKRNLLEAGADFDAITSATGKTLQFSTLEDLKGPLPKGKIGNTEMTRLIIGGNLIGGFAHARDLIYVDSLFMAYNTEQKVFDTLQLAEQAGIDTINFYFTEHQLINKYKRIYGSSLQTMVQIHPKKDDIYTHVDQAIDNGIDVIQIQGNCCDWRVRDGEMDVLAKCIDHAKGQGYPTGLGAHSIQALIECEKAGIDSDFYMKTFHHDRYWSAHPRENRIPYSVDTFRSEDHNEFHDNMFCLFPEETIEFFENIKKPVIGFKVLAGGSIHPEDGFRFAFENGADFICVGMFDYQIVDDVNITLDVLNSDLKRKRPWMA